MNETTGVLRPAVLAYLRGEPMTGEHVAAMRAYLRQWIEAPLYDHGAGVAELRAMIDGLDSRAAIRSWFDLAGDMGIDPL